MGGHDVMSNLGLIGDGRRTVGRAVALGLALAWVCGRANAAEGTRRYAIVIGNNEVFDQGTGTTRLSYADQDAIKFFEVFAAADVRVALLVALDADAQRRFPAAANVARPPTRQQLLAALEAVFGQMRDDRRAGRETDFYFVYSGHGGLGPNREGYVSLLDARFSRSQLYREVVGPSPATYNHIILDACQAYYFVQKRGAQTDKEGDFRQAARDFLATEDLASHPNTGVILAASSESETHEWGRWEAGIFSHELRSALLGAADVDGDGRITYQEAAAFVEAANAAIDVPRARLRVFYWPPAVRPDRPLLEVASFAATPVLEVDAEHAGRFSIEDARGVRLADFHSSGEQTTRMSLVGQEPFFLRTGEREAAIRGQTRVGAGELVFSALSEGTKGSVEETFRRNLFRVPFGRVFYREIVAAREGAEQRLRGEVEEESRRVRRVWGWGTIATGTAVGVGAWIMYGLARASYGDYQKAASDSLANELRATTESRLLVSRILGGAAVGLAVAGALQVFLGSPQREPETGRIAFSASAAPSGSGFVVGATGSW